jgi:hypothetical protein
MELQSDAALLQGCSGANLDPQAQAAAQGFYLGQAGDSSDAEVGQKQVPVVAAVCGVVCVRHAMARHSLHCTAVYWHVWA